MFRILFGLIVLSILPLIFVIGCDTPPQYPSPHASAIEADVIEVVDGDTIMVRIDNTNVESVRYIGIDTGEVGHKRYGWTSERGTLGREAAEKNLKLVGGKTVMLEWDVSYTDKYGRLLCYVWIDNIFVNAELVRLGLARAVAYPPDTKYRMLFEELEEKADKQHRGIWGVYPHTPR